MHDWIISAMMAAMLSSGGSAPFWMGTNQYGLIPEGDGTAAVFSARSEYDGSGTWQFRGGISFAGLVTSATDGDGSGIVPLPADFRGEWHPEVAQSVVGKETQLYEGRSAGADILLDELYAGAKWKWLALDLGMKRPELDFYGSVKNLGSLSVTGGDLMQSGNSRNFAGYTAYLDRLPIPFTGKRILLSGKFADYATLDHRYYDNTLIHDTEVRFDILLSKRLTFTLLVANWAQWAGSCPTYSMDITPENYVRMVLGMKGGDGSLNRDAVNVLGDQAGHENFRFTWKGDGYTVAAQHDIPYNDISGMKFKNFPDGVNTIHFSLEDKDRWITDVLYEFQYTGNQSGPVHERPATDEEKAAGEHLTSDGQKYILGGDDDYFNSEEYITGWTYYGRTIGNPLFTTALRNAYGETFGVLNNRVTSHHFALSGKLFRKAPYRLMLTWSKNEGIFEQRDASRFSEPLSQFSAGFNGFWNLGEKGLALTWGLYGDCGALLEKQAGLSLGLRWDMNFRRR